MQLVRSPLWRALLLASLLCDPPQPAAALQFETPHLAHPDGGGAPPPTTCAVLPQGALACGFAAPAGGADHALRTAFNFSGQRSVWLASFAGCLQFIEYFFMCCFLLGFFF
jgi:hypothetical protein